MNDLSPERLLFEDIRGKKIEAEEFLAAHCNSYQVLQEISSSPQNSSLSSYL